jgi:hypothetical protein
VDIIRNPEDIPQVSALVDSGATSSFIDQTFVAQHNIPVVKKSTLVPVEVIDGRTISSGAITHETTLYWQAHGEDCSQHHLHPSPSHHPWSALARSTEPYH